MRRVLWGYDESTGDISTLPASPWLLPALGLLAFATLLERTGFLSENGPVSLPAGFNEKEWRENSERYHYLVDKEFSGEGLTISEQYELTNKLPHPSWAQPGEYWTY